MAAALTPELALAYVRELSADVRAGVVLDAAGAVLAGDGRLAGSSEGAGVLVEASPHHRIAVECGPYALEAVVRRDLRMALASLDSAV